MDSNSVQHINVKILLEQGQSVDLSETIPVFHRWIRGSACPEMLIDVADYRHVLAGPGVLLIGHEANYSLDENDGRLGLLYNRKASIDGTFQDRLDQAYHAARSASERLEQEDGLQPQLKFDFNNMEIFINDRLLAPNNEATWAMLRPELERFFPDYTIERRGEPRDRFWVSLTRPFREPSFGR